MNQILRVIPYQQVKDKVYKLTVNYVFSTSDVFTEEIRNGLLSSLTDFLSASWKFITSLAIFVLYLLLIVVKLVILIFPHFVQFTTLVIDFHRTQLTYKDIIIEITVITIMLIYYIFRKRISHVWKKFETSVAKKSKAAARAAPHVLFFTVSSIFAVVGQKFLSYLASSSVLPFFTIGWPFFTTFRLVFFGDPEKKRHYYRPKLSLWVVLATYHSIATLLSAIPFSKMILLRIQFLREMIVVVFIWAQISPVFTEIVFDMAEPVLRSAFSQVPSVDLNENQRNTLFTVLRAFRLINSDREGFLISLFQDGMALICAILFIFTPFPVIGTVIVAFVFPAFKSMRSIALTEKNGLDFDAFPSSNLSSYTIGFGTPNSKQGADTTSVIKTPVSSSITTVNSRNTKTDEVKSVSTFSFFSPSTKKSAKELKAEENNRIRNERIRWLEYWMCLGGLWFVRAYRFPLWHSITILLALWLQHSYFLGSSRVKRFLIDLGEGFTKRNQELALRHQLENELEAIADKDIRVPIADTPCMNEDSATPTGWFYGFCRHSCLTESVITLDLKLNFEPLDDEVVLDKNRKLD
jgi:hypothetical protein